jgi:hypothetical protein
MRTKYEVSTGKPEGRRPLGTPRRRLGDNIKEIVWKCVDWINLACDCDHSTSPE